MYCLCCCVGRSGFNGRVRKKNPDVYCVRRFRINPICLNSFDYLRRELKFKLRYCSSRDSTASKLVHVNETVLVPVSHQKEYANTYRYKIIDAWEDFFEMIYHLNIKI